MWPFGRNKTETRSWGELERLILAANETAAGISVSPEGALKCPVVLACVRVLSDSVAQLPLILYRRGPDGAKERATDHPLYRLLHDAPNGWTTAAEWRASMMVQALIHGDAYAVIGRARGQVVEVVQAPAGAIQTDVDLTTWEPIHRGTLADGSYRVFQPGELFRLRVPGPDPVRGLSLVNEAREAIALALQLEAYAARLFGKGARPSGALKVPGRLSPESLARLQSSIASRHGGANNAGTLVLEEGMSFEQMQFSSTDAQYIELFRHQIAQIARVFRVPLHMIQELERTTHSNAEAMGQQYLSTVLLPWLKLWEQAIARDLLNEEERGEYFAEFLVDDLVKADLASRMTAYTAAVSNGIMSPNECRALENRTPYQGGDAFHRPLNTGEAGHA
ncbi:phage portal protein [Pararhodospirillum oryzae]|uniref:Portal protein n=1 Tax=Pararhodospirillum oryzae TaxID=478448 RepID=A0A512HAY1_9PROT|nr:phage portal protein [Pararhodospirillum oryzae]GEO82602.1 portal protein [Pararhodospirillum oryzae]